MPYDLVGGAGGSYRTAGSAPAPGSFGACASSAATGSFGTPKLLGVGTQIRLGVGGGSGHKLTNAAGPPGTGGKGGGAVLIHARHICGNGAISANGENGGPAAGIGASSGGGGQLTYELRSICGHVHHHSCK